jgi:hypothetical protein
MRQDRFKSRKKQRVQLVLRKKRLESRNEDFAKSMLESKSKKQEQEQEGELE